MKNYADTEIAGDTQDKEGTGQFPARSIAWMSVGILLVLGILAFLDRQIISLMVDPIKRDLGVSDFQISLLQGFAFGILYSLAGLPLGYAVDRYSRRWVIFFGVFFWALCTSICGLAGTYSVLLMARIGVGLGEAALAPAAYSILSDLFPRHKLALALSVYSIGSLLGSSLAYVIGGLVLAWAQSGGVLFFAPELHPWQIAFLVAGLPGLILAFVIFLMPEPKRQSSGIDGQGSWTALRIFIIHRARFLSCHFAASACVMVVAYAKMSWIAVILQRSYALPIAQVGILMGLWSAATGIFGLLFNGSVVDKLYSRNILDAHMRYYAYGMLIVALVGGLSAVAPGGIWGYLLILAPSTILGNFIGVAAAALQIATPAELRGRMSALFIAIISIAGLTIGPSFPAFLTDFVFQDPAMVKYSLALTMAIFAPIAALFFALGMKPMREISNVR